MKFTFSWLKDYLETTAPLDKIVEGLIGVGLEVEEVVDKSKVLAPFKVAYVSAKHGLAGMTKTIALELAEHGVTANAICPGYVLTPLVEKQIPEQAKARGISEEAVMRDILLAAQSTKKFVAISKVASLALYLCSDDACSITGALLPIDGGWTAH